MCVLRSASRRRRRRQSCSRVDCVVHSWSSWSPCSAKRCGQPGTQERRRTVHLPPICGGTACPSLVDIVPCQGNAPADCQLSSWSSWSTCSLPCGGTQTSSRYVVTKEQCGGVPFSVVVIFVLFFCFLLVSPFVLFFVCMSFSLMSSFLSAL